MEINTEKIKDIEDIFLLIEHPKVKQNQNLYNELVGLSSIFKIGSDAIKMKDYVGQLKDCLESLYIIFKNDRLYRDKILDISRGLNGVED